jgi:hypothetical protein
MANEQMILLLIRDTLASLDKPDEERVEECAAKLRELMAEYGDHGPMALALVGAEQSAQEAADA